MRDEQCDEIEATVAELLQLGQRIALAPAEPAPEELQSRS